MKTDDILDGIVEDFNEVKKQEGFLRQVLFERTQKWLKRVVIRDLPDKQDDIENLRKHAAQEMSAVSDLVIDNYIDYINSKLKGVSEE